MQEKEKCEQLEGKLKDCQQQIEKLQSDVRDHQREEQKLVEQICVRYRCFVISEHAKIPLRA